MKTNLNLRKISINTKLWAVILCLTFICAGFNASAQFTESNNHHAILVVWPTVVITSTTNPNCSGNNGAITITASGGTPFEESITGPGFSGQLPYYKYLWSNGATTQNLSNVPGGEYCVSVTDANGEIGGACVTLSPPSPLQANPTASYTNIAYGSAYPDAIYANASGGTSPYLYSWSALSLVEEVPIKQTNETILYKNANEPSISFLPTNGGITQLGQLISITVTDHNGCSVDTSVCINCVIPYPYEPQNFGPSSSGGPPGKFPIEKGKFYDGDEIQNSSKVDEITTPSSNEIQELNINAYPNPFVGSFNLKVNGSTNENANVKVFDLTGRLVNYQSEVPVGNEITLGAELPAGAYIIEATQGAQSKTARIIKTQ